MIEITEPKQFQWAHGNERKSSEKHNVSKEEAEQVFFNQPLLLLEDKAHSQNETRFHAMGKQIMRENCTLPSQFGKIK